MDTDLEQRLRIELHDDARRAHLASPTAPRALGEHSVADRTRHESTRRHRPSDPPAEGTPVANRGRPLAAAAAAAVVIVAGVAGIALVNRSTSDPPHATAPTTDDERAFAPTRRAVVTWYAPDGTETGNVAGDELVCTAPRADGGCDALAGRRTVIHRTRNGQVDVITEYGSVESSWWQELVRSGEPTDLGGYPGLLIPSNDELAGFRASFDTRVVLVGEANTNPADLVSTLTTHQVAVDVPVTFGESVASEEELPRGSHVDGVNARYYAGYLDITTDPPCIAGIGVPSSGTSCVPVDPDTLAVALASPSPTGTILIASVPLRTATAVVTGQDAEQHELEITDASHAGYKLVFADLDGFIADELVAIDRHGVEIDRAPITGSGGAPLGYLPVSDGN